MADTSVSCTDTDIVTKRKEMEPYEDSESLSECESLSQSSESSKDDVEAVRVPGGPIVTNPDLLRYQKEIRAYEGFYVTDNQTLRKRCMGGVHPCLPQNETDKLDDVVNAAKLAIKQFNETEEKEPLEFEELVRSSWALITGVLYFITFRASNGKFYETKVCVLYNDNFKFYFLREAKYHPNLGIS